MIRHGHGCGHIDGHIDASLPFNIASNFTDTHTVTDHRQGSQIMDLCMASYSKIVHTNITKSVLMVATPAIISADVQIEHYINATVIIVIVQCSINGNNVDFRIPFLAHLWCAYAMALCLSWIVRREVGCVCVEHNYPKMWMD